MIFDGMAGTRRLLTDIGASVRIDASFAERIEFESALDPREAISQWRRHVAELVRIAPVQTGLQPAVERTDIVGPEVFLTQPKFTLRRAAREDHMGEALDLASDCLICGLPPPPADVPSVAPLVPILAFLVVR